MASDSDRAESIYTDPLRVRATIHRFLFLRLTVGPSNASLQREPAGHGCLQLKATAHGLCDSKKEEIWLETGVPWEYDIPMLGMLFSLHGDVLSKHNLRLAAKGTTAVCNDFALRNALL